MFLLWQAWKNMRMRKNNFFVFSFNMFGPQLQDLKVWCYLKPSVVALKKNPWSIEALSDLGISGALHWGQRTSTDGAALGIALQTWGCIFNFSNIPVHPRFEISSSLDVLWSCGNGSSSEHTCIHGAANRLPCQLQACMLLANWGQWRAAHILCELLSHFRIIWNWFRVWLNYGRCRYGLRSLCWAMRWLHTIQAYNIGGCWRQSVLFLHEGKVKDRRHILGIVDADERKTCCKEWTQIYVGVARRGWRCNRIPKIDHRQRPKKQTWMGLRGDMMRYVLAIHSRISPPRSMILLVESRAGLKGPETSPN